MTIAANQIRKDRLVSILNQKLIAANQTPIDGSFYRVSNPVPYFGNKSTKNTKVTIIPIGLPGVLVKKNLYYDRINLGSIPRFELFRKGTMISDLLPDINDYFGLDFQPYDIVDQAIPNPVNLNKFVNANLVISTDSHMFTGALALKIKNPVLIT